MRLMIVESPTKAKKIASILGYDWVVKASMGHVVDLPNRELGVEPQTYRLSYVPSPRGEEIIASLRQLARKADEIYLASDPDREGEAISAHIKTFLDIDRYKRVTFHEITEDGIRAALQAPRRIDQQLVSSQEARRALDRLIGYRVSYPLSSHAGMDLSAGRCQSPAVRLIVERQDEIDDFKATDHYTALAEFESGKWTAQWKTKPFLGAECEYILDRPLAERAASCRHFLVVDSSEKLHRTAPPSPLTTSGLLQAASATLGYSPALTQSLAQQLFEEGHITYHRTDNPNLSDHAVASIRALADSEGWPLAEAPRRWRPPEGAQEAHEAIRPTHFARREAGAEQLRSLYQLIWRRAIASQLADAVYNVVTLDLQSQSNGQTFEFLARNAVQVSEGWKTIVSEDMGEDDERKEESSGQVPLLKRGAQITATTGKVENHATKAPRRYTEASLIRKLEQMGIGRPSTFASIVKHISEKGYARFQDRHLVPTSAGYAVIRSLEGRFCFMDYDFTKNLERRLDSIAEGKADYIAVVSDLDQKLDQEIAEFTRQKPAFPCPACGKPLHLIFFKGHSFWGCSGYRDGCLVSCENDDGRPGNIRSHAPSDKALAFARRLAAKNELVIPEKTLTSAKDLGAWIDDTLAKARSGKASAPRAARIRSIVPKRSAMSPSDQPGSTAAKDAEISIAKRLGADKKSEAAAKRSHGRKRRENILRSEQRATLAKAVRPLVSDTAKMEP